MGYNLFKVDENYDLQELVCMMSLFFSVRRLQEAICQCYHIPEDKQVLLISGGENLDPNARVCSYSAGMVRSRPIYHLALYIYNIFSGKFQTK